MRFMMNKGLAACGLACAACREEECPGCFADGCENAAQCGILRCVREKDIAGCHACDDFPCEQAMFDNPRVRAFVRYAKAYGVEQLLERLEANAAEGIAYHREDGLSGDYDGLSEQEVWALLEFGHDKDPFAKCPIFETEHFTLRLVRHEDAEDLLACYGDPAVWPVLNADNCTSTFRYTTMEEMAECVGFFVSCYAQGYFVRWAIVEKESGKAVGTVEMFTGETGVLRVDIVSRLEQEEPLAELFALAARKMPPLFGAARMLTKAPPEAKARRAALAANGYDEIQMPDREHYFVFQP